jgi:magnesium chelatase family protein
MLVAAMNPTASGYAATSSDTPKARDKYLQKLSGPLLDRIEQHCDLSDSCLLLMKQAMDELGLSARAYDKVRRVARTIADIDGSEKIQELHVAEAVQYRLLDRKF